MTVTDLDVLAEPLDDLSDYFYGAPVGLLVTDEDGTVSLTNLAQRQLLGWESADGIVGQHVAGNFVDLDEAARVLERLHANLDVLEYDATLAKRDGDAQRVLIYANAKVDGNGQVVGARWIIFPHPDQLRPDVAEVGALTDQSVGGQGIPLSPSERARLFDDLSDFFDNAPIGLHMVGGDGLIQRASQVELEAMGYGSADYIGQHIARFHADQNVIDGMLHDLVEGSPLINFSATLSRSDGAEIPVMIYSNSRMRQASFVNTRCFTVPVPSSRKLPDAAAPTYSWPRNEDLGFGPAAGPASGDAPPDSVTLALKYIASRKLPEESLGFLSHVSRILAETRPLAELVGAVTASSVPFLGDFVSIDLGDHLGHASLPTMGGETEARLVDFVSAGVPDDQLSVSRVAGSGQPEVYFDLAAEDTPRCAELRAMGIESAMVLPIAVRSGAVGALTLMRERAATRRRFGPADLALAEELSRRLAFAIEIDALTGR